jgi:hypothetical protein
LFFCPSLLKRELVFFEKRFFEFLFFLGHICFFRTPLFWAFFWKKNKFSFTGRNILFFSKHILPQKGVRNKKVFQKKTKIQKHLKKKKKFSFEGGETKCFVSKNKIFYQQKQGV